jgi:hypothetical protein
MHKRSLLSALGALAIFGASFGGQNLAAQVSPCDSIQGCVLIGVKIVKHKTPGGSDGGTTVECTYRCN